MRWRRPADGICELCNVKISASNWSRHLKRKHPNNLKYFIRPSSRETTVTHRRDATSTDVISQLPPPHSSSTSPTPSVSGVKHGFIAPHTITIPSSTPSVHVYAARPISSASAVTELINGSGGADLSAEARLLTVPKINRLFTLFVATAGLTVSDLENEYLAVSFSIIYKLILIILYSFSSFTYFRDSWRQFRIFIYRIDRWKSK